MHKGTSCFTIARQNVGIEMYRLAGSQPRNVKEFIQGALVTLLMGIIEKYSCKRAFRTKEGKEVGKQKMDQKPDKQTVCERRDAGSTAGGGDVIHKRAQQTKHAACGKKRLLIKD